MVSGLGAAAANAHTVAADTGLMCRSSQGHEGKGEGTAGTGSEESAAARAVRRLGVR